MDSDSTTINSDTQMLSPPPHEQNPTETKMNRIIHWVVCKYLVLYAVICCVLFVCKRMVVWTYMDSAATSSMQSRVNSVFRYEFVFSAISFLVYHRIMQLIEQTFASGDSIKSDLDLPPPNSSVQNKRRCRARVSWLRIVLIIWLVSGHLTFLLFWMQDHVPVVIGWLCALSLGVWLHVAPLCILFTALNLFVWSVSLVHSWRSCIDNLMRRLPPVFCSILIDSVTQTKLTLIISALLSALSMWGAFSYHVSRFDVSFSKHPVPDTAVNSRIVVLSDIHVGGVVGAWQVQSVVQQTNLLQPDVVVLVGDLVDGRVDQLMSALEPLKQLRAKHGIYFVTGNHEYYYSNVSKWYVALEHMGIQILHNTAHTTTNGLCLAGLDDLTLRTLHDLPWKASYGKRVLSGCKRDAPVISLIHNPFFAYNLSDATLLERTDLILSGHVHAGQFYHLAPLLWLRIPFFCGWYQVDRQPSASPIQVYVSAGVHFFAVPMKMIRFADITQITLTR